MSVTVQTDTTGPTVAITAPAGGATVSGPVTVSANASDNVAVANVQFLLDGNALGSPDTTSPYSISWDTTGTANGTHTLSARATDTSGNGTTSAPVSVTVSNTQGTTPPAFVQTNVNSVGTGTKATVAFNSANTAGNLIAVYVVWDNTGAVSVSDSRNNTYAAASARTTWQGSWSAQVFYAKNIAAGANTVTATFATGITSFGLVYVHEYSGLDKTNPVDVSAGAIGSAAAMSSGAATTTFANDLLFGAGASTSTVSAVGTGFTSRSAAFGNRTEDRVVSAVGSYAATATQNGSGWVMQLVAFRSATASNDTTAPNVAITAPAGGATVSGSVTVSANASDNVAVGGVQFLLDGNALGSQDTTSPYSVSWDTTAAANGVHALTARATDTSGNTTTSVPVSVTVSNAVSGPTAPPVAAYAFNEGTGTTTADSSGNGLTGTLVNGATWAPGKYGNAVSLDGVNDLVDLGNPPALQFGGSMTISGWINAGTFPTDDAVIVSKKTVDGIGYQLDTTQDSGSRTVGFKLTNSAGADMIRYGATPLQANTWYHVAGVYNAASQTMDVYLNGVLDNGAQVGTITTTQQTSTANVNIGQRAGAYSFAGLIDEVRLYGRALTGPEIQADMNTPIGNTWASYFGNNRSGWAVNENGFNPTSAANLHLAWKANDTGPDHGVFSQPAVVNGTVYWGSFDGYERATDTAGNLRWQTFLGDTHDPTCTDPSNAGVVSTATVRSDVPIGSATSVLYVGGGDTRMYALNAATGAVLWSTLLGQNPDHFIWSSPLVYGNSVYIGMSSFGTCPDVQGQLVQLDRVTGAIQHTFNAVPNGCVGGGVWSSPTIDIAAGTIYFGTGNQDPCNNGAELAPAVVEVHASDLSVVGSWTLPLNQQPNDDSDFGATPTLFNGTIGGQATALVGLVNKNGVFYAFKRDAISSGPVWSTRVADGGDDPNIGTGDVGTAAYDGSTLYVAGDINNTLGCDGTLNALDPSTGQFIWRHCFTGGFPLGGVTGASGGVVAVGEGKNIVVFNAATGATVFTFAGAGMFVGAPSIVNGTLYEGDMAGDLYALKT